MTVNLNEITMAYRLILGRTPSEHEQVTTEKRETDLETLRRRLLFSLEFTRRYDKMRRLRSKSLPKTVIHIHIPKTAGTSVNNILGQSFGPRFRLPLSTPTMHLLHDMPLQKRRNLRAIHGHFTHGIDRYLVQDSVYICVLRRPAPRVFSFFGYVSRTQTHPLYKLISAKNMTFGEFLEYSSEKRPVRNEVDNGQVRRLAGELTPEETPNKAQLFRQALANIFAPNMQFGLTEEFEAFLDRLVARGIIRHYKPVHTNTAPKGSDYDQAVDRLTPAQRDLLDGFTFWDNQLYDICKTYILALSAQKEPIS